MARRSGSRGRWLFVGAWLVLGALFLALGAAYGHLFGGSAVAGKPAAGGTEWDWQELGQLVFANNCASCHGMTGEGIPGVFPAFQGNEFVLGEPKAVIRVPMNGRGGMPSFRNALSDEQLAAVLSYIRNSWGNEAEPITPGLVADVRAQS